MPIYSQENMLRIAKRFHNTKRTYLLVDPLQAKHIPVSPTEALEMMAALGARLRERYPKTGLVIAFAETATAVGAAAASLFPDCVYLPTTREEGAGDWVTFLEEHSHAVEQKLWGGSLAERIEAAETIVLVDDEITTGKTLLNMVRQLRARCPALAGKELVAASLLNRLSPENEARLEAAGVRCEHLLKLPAVDYTAAVAPLSITEAPAVTGEPLPLAHMALPGAGLPDPRRGLPIRDYLAACRASALAFMESAPLEGCRDLVVLGTEECMYPALVLGRLLEERGHRVRCHATTRSPIGICDAPDYPITAGGKIRSFYQPGRETYLYDMAPCDALVVVSDTLSQDKGPLADIAALWGRDGWKKLFYMQGGRDVWYI